MLMTLARLLTGRTMLYCWRIRTDGVGNDALGKCLLGHVPGEIVAAEPDVEQDAAPLGIPDFRNDLAVGVDHLAEIAVVEMRDHVAGFSDLECFRGQKVTWVLQLELADVHVERQVEYFRKPFGELERSGAVFADGVAFQVTQQASVLLREIQPAVDGHIAEGPHIALDEIEAEKPHRPDERPDVEAGFERIHDRHELVERVDTGTACFDEGRHALIDPDAVRIGEAERAVGMDMKVDPARREIVAGEVDARHRRIDRSFAHRQDRSGSDGDIGDAVDAETGIDDVRVFQEQLIATEVCQGGVSKKQTWKGSEAVGRKLIRRKLGRGGPIEAPTVCKRYARPDGRGVLAHLYFYSFGRPICHENVRMSSGCRRFERTLRKIAAAWQGCREQIWRRLQGIAPASWLGSCYGVAPVRSGVSGGTASHVRPRLG